VWSTTLLRRLSAVLAAAVLAGCATAPSKNSKMGDPIYLYKMGISQFSQGHFLEAEQYFRDALKIDPKMIMTWNMLGKTYLFSGRLEEAQAALEKAIQIQPSFAEAHNNMGTVFLQKGDLVKAEAEFNLALRDTTYSQSPQVWFNLGMVAYQKGNYSEAITQFGRALSLNKEYAVAMLGRARAYEKMRQTDQAKADLRRYLELRPEDPEGLFTLGRTLVNEKSFVEARPLLERVWLLAPSSTWGQEAKKLLDLIQ